MKILFRNTFRSITSHLAIFAMVLAFACAKAVAEPFFFIDSDGNGSESVTLSGSGSVDPDGAVIDYVWRVNTVLVSSGFGPHVPDLVRNYNIGWSTVTLTVRDDVQVSSFAVARVVVFSQGANQPPIAGATVPSVVQANSLNVGTVTVNASLSSDPEGDPIFRYVWTEGATTLYDGAFATASFILNGLGNHTVQLKVYSKDNFNIVQSGTKNFIVTLVPPGGRLAGWTFTRVIGQDFSFSDVYGDFAGLTYNALSQTYYMTDNKLDKIFEIQSNGTLIRTIDIASLKAAGETEADAEGITWLGGTKYALVSEGAEEMLVVNITGATTSLTRAQATIFDLSGDPKGVAYSPIDDSIYWVSENNPMRVVKSKINATTGNLDEIFSKDMTGLPCDNLSDIAFFPRLSPFPFMISHSSRVVMEVDINGATPVLKSSFSLSGWDIPEGSSLMFGADARMYITSKHVANTPEDDFNVFATTGPVPNRPPNPKIDGIFGWMDSDGDGFELATVQGVNSFDPDGAIIKYRWEVNGSLVSEGFGPKVGDLSHLFAVGNSTITLKVFDDGQLVAEKTEILEVLPHGSNLPPLASAIVPGTVPGDLSGNAQMLVDASASSDPENDPINRYLWTEGASTLFDGASATATLSVNGLGNHTLQLRVFSTDSQFVTQSGTASYQVAVVPFEEKLAGRVFNRVIGQDFFLLDMRTSPA